MASGYTVLCAFHFLQHMAVAVEFNIRDTGNDRLLFMSMVKELLFAESSEKLLAAKHRIA